MGVLEFITSIVFMVLVAITTWILLLRNSRRQQRIAPEGNYRLDELAAIAESLQQRIDILESILDAEVPDWKEQTSGGISGQRTDDNDSSGGQ